jgi:hypothetical protein
VFCLEGPWSSRLTDRSSVRPLLELLDNLGLIRFIHRDASTLEEFSRYLTQWLQRQYQGYGFGWLAFHGDPGGIYVGRRFVTLEQIAEITGARLARRILFFGSCGTLEVPQPRLDAFMRATKVRAICGYSESEVGWLESAAFELNLIEAVTRYDRVDAGFNWLRKHHGYAWRRLGFRCLW